MRKNKRFVFRCDDKEREAITFLAANMRLPEGEAVRTVVLEAAQALKKTQVFMEGKVINDRIKS